VSSSKSSRDDKVDSAESWELSPSDLSAFHRECRARGYQVKLSPREPRDKFPGVLRYDLTVHGRDVWHGYLVPPYDRALERAMQEVKSLQSPGETVPPGETEPAAEPAGWRRLRYSRKR
jgi:hypothetical protein